MPRIDAWDVKKPTGRVFELGFPPGLQDVYEWGPELGKGGFGSVRLVRRRDTGVEFACKSIFKELKAANVSEKQQRHHLEMITREVAVLQKLVGTLNVVRLEDVFEDDERVHIVMEHCRGGELWRRAGLKSFSEETVAKIMRAVLRTLAQCHAHRILHRDVKPGNFMLLTTEENSPVKAIDFGMAVFYEPNELPRRDLGFDGTPWFMAPEVLSSQVVPASDVWSAGVMAYQLLTGYLPFDDRKNKRGPVLSVIWKGILTEEPSFTRKYWGGISDEAIDFVRTLLHKDPTSRPTAKQALKHPWVRRGGAKPTQLSETVVQRIQRFGQSSIFKRTVLDMVANELIQRSHGEREHGLAGDVKMSAVEFENPAVVPADDAPPDRLREEQTWHSGMNFRRSLSLPISNLRTDHGGALWHGLAGEARKLVGQSLKKGKPFCSQEDLTRIASTSVTEWEQKRMLMREALDTSTHGGLAYSADFDNDLIDDYVMDDWMRTSLDKDDLPLTDGSCSPSPPSNDVMPLDGELRCSLQDMSEANALSHSDIASEPAGVPFTQHIARKQSPSKCGIEGQDKCGRGQTCYRQFVEAQGGSLESPRHREELDGPLSPCRTSGFEMPLETSGRDRPGVGRKTVRFASDPPRSYLSESLNKEEIKPVLESMQLTSQGSASAEEITEGLKQLGYRLEPSEVLSLMQSMAPGNARHVNFSQFMASQVDWQAVQRNSHEEWLESVRQAFDNLDKDADGRIDSQDFLHTLRQKLPPAEVDAAVENAAVEMCADELDMDFEGFVRLLRVDSSDSLHSLDQYDARVGSLGQSSQYTSLLETVPEY